MIKEILNISPKIIFFSLFYSLLAILISPFLWEALIVIAIAFLNLKFGRDFIVPLIIVFFLTVSGDVNENIRNFINVLNIFLLLYLFLYEYGFYFQDYPKIPNIILLFFSFVGFSLFISTLFSVNIVLGLNEIARQLIFLAIIFFLYGLIKSKKEIYLYLAAILFSSLVIVTAIIIEFLKTDTILYTLMTTGYVTLGGFFNNASAVGGFFAVSIPLTLILYFHPKLNERKFKFLTLFFLTLQTLGILLTNSRAAITGTFIAILFVLFVLKRSAAKKVILTILIIIPFLFLLPGYETIFDHYLRTDRIFENTRYILWDMSFKIFKDNPIFGIGPGMFNYYMYPYLTVLLGSWSEGQIYYLYTHAPLGSSHSFLLMKLSELGLFGFVSGIALFVIYLKIGFKIIKEVKIVDYEYYIFSVSAVGIGIGLFYRSLFESTGLLTNGWITRDLPFWIIFMIMIFIYTKINIRKDIIV